MDIIGFLILDWLEFAIRWLHIITAIAWIGSSFYFIALDLGLRQHDNLSAQVHGEEWQVHGGGFYHIQKYLVSPARMPENLTWFKWESYATWLSGFALMVLVYYLGADLYLIDKEKFDLPVEAAISVSLVILIVTWLCYNWICRSRLGDNDTQLMILLYVILIGLSWGFAQIFTGRAAFVHLGAVTATIMTCNVFFIIIPNQKIVVADLIAGKTPQPHYGKIAKQRSTHNNYLTLPVIFLMVSNHYPLAFATEYSWIIASLVFLMGVSIRYYYNNLHARTGKSVWWTWVITAILFIAIIGLSTAPLYSHKNPEESAEQDLSTLGPAVQKYVTESHFEQVSSIVQGRCSMCHAKEPYYEGIIAPPKGIMLETEGQIAQKARSIYLQTSASSAMPPANVTYMEPEERALIATWFKNAQMAK